MNTNLYEIGLVIDYIETNLLEEKMDLDSLTSVTGYSKYHLHRMFSTVTGLTIHNYILRRRLTEAARMLVFTDRPVLDIALCAGYDSQRSFSRSFLALYKISPASYRKHKSFMPLQLKYDISNRRELRGDRILDIRTADEGAICLTGYRRSTRMGFSVIGKCWHLLHANKDKIPGRIDENFLLGVNDYSQFEPGKTHPAFHYMAAAQVKSGGQAPKGMETFTLPPSRYVIFSFRGRNQESLQPVAEYIYRQWFPGSTCHFNENNRYDFAKYGESTDENGRSDIEFWVPVV